MKAFWRGMRHLELYEIIGLLVSLLCIALFFAYGSALDAKQGQPGWHYTPVLWIWAIYRDFIPKALATAFAVLMLIGWWRHRDWRWGVKQTLAVVRFGLPFVVVLIIYRAVNWYIPLFSPHDRDNWLLAADKWMFGNQPSLWLQQYVSPHLTDVFSLAYTIWFPLIFFTMLLMMLKSREAVTGYVTSVLISFYIGYLCYNLVPAVGPVFTLKHVYTVALDGGSITQLQASMVASDVALSVPRDCFPSLHTAISCVMCWYVGKYFKKLLWLYAPIAVTILGSTIYLRYHYAADVLAGIAMAAGTSYFGGVWNAKWRARRAAAAQADDASTPGVASTM